MKTDFAQPRFTGTRFDEHTLPVDVARDLAAYESLIVDLAKHLYLTNHPERQRVPKGFAANFRLDIDRIDPGSAMPNLVVVLSRAERGVRSFLFPPLSVITRSERKDQSLRRSHPSK